MTLTSAPNYVFSSNSTAGIIVRADTAAETANGALTITNVTSNSWVSTGSFVKNTTTANISAGSKTLSDTLTQVRITTVNGTDTFDAGTINIIYEG
jgi:hypothetical protein